MAILISEYCCNSSTSKRWNIVNSSTDPKVITLLCASYVNDTSTFTSTLVTVPGLDDNVYCFDAAILGASDPYLTITQVGTSCITPQPETFVTIGSQTWTVKNLDVEYYRNGDRIPQVSSSAYWNNLPAGVGAWCYAGNNPLTGLTYGKLYNWAAINDARGLAPEGYHIPTKAEWLELATFLSQQGPDQASYNVVESGGIWVDVADKIIENGTTHWTAPNLGNNETDFTALGAGFRPFSGTTPYIDFLNLKTTAAWWSSSQGVSNPSTQAFTATIFHEVNGKNLFTTQVIDKRAGYSVRLIKDCETVDNLSSRECCPKTFALPVAGSNLSTYANIQITPELNAQILYAGTNEAPPLTPSVLTWNPSNCTGIDIPQGTIIFGAARAGQLITGYQTLQILFSETVNNIKLVLKTYNFDPSRDTFTVEADTYPATVTLCGDSCYTNIDGNSVSIGSSNYQVPAAAIIEISKENGFRSIVLKEYVTPNFGGVAIGLCYNVETTTTTTLPPYESPENFCCFTTNCTRHFVRVRRNENSEVLIVKCGTKVHRLIIPPHETYSICLDTYVTHPNILVFRLNNSTSCVPNTGLPIITIGTKIWMKENLKVTNYQNGAPIYHVEEDRNCRNRLTHKCDHTLGMSQGAYVYTDLGTGIEVISEENRNQYGLLYNYAACVDPRGLLPKGWRLPTIQDFRELMSDVRGRFKGTFVSAGNMLYNTTIEFYSGANALKTTDYQNDWIPLFGALNHINTSRNTDASGFSAKAAGHRTRKSYNTNKLGALGAANDLADWEPWESSFKRVATFWGTGSKVKGSFYLDSGQGSNGGIDPNAEYDTFATFTLSSCRDARYEPNRNTISFITDDYKQCYNSSGNFNCLARLNTMAGDLAMITDGGVNWEYTTVCGFLSQVGLSGSCRYYGWAQEFRSVRGVLDCPTYDNFPWFSTTPGISTTTSTTTKCIIKSYIVNNLTNCVMTYVCIDANGEDRLEYAPAQSSIIICNICDIHRVEGCLVDDHYDIGDSIMNALEALNNGLYTIEETNLCDPTTTTTIPGPCCKVVLPLPNQADQDFTIGTTIVHPTYTGPTLPDYPVYVGPNCTYQDMPAAAVTLGRTRGSFTYQLTFSQPTTQVVLLVYGGGGSAKALEGTTIGINGGPSRFVFDTNATLTNIYFCTAYHCYAQTETLLPDQPPPTVLNIGGPRTSFGYTPGAVFVVIEGLSSNNSNAVTPFTELTISGDGIGGGASFAICDKLWPATTTTTIIPPAPVCKLHVSSLTNNTDFDHNVIYYATDNTFILSQITVPANATIQLCAYDVIYVPPTITWTPSNVECCSTSTTTTSTTTTTTTAPPPCNTWQATFIGQIGGSASFDYTDCNGIVHSPIVGLGIPALPTSIQFCALGLPIGNPQIQIIQIASDQCSTSTTTTSTTSTTTTTTIAPVCNTYQAVYTLNSGTSSCTYIDCNGVTQIVTVGAGTPLYPQSVQFCALQIISALNIQVTVIASNQCSTSTTTTSTTTTTIAPVTPCTQYSLDQANNPTPRTFTYLDCNGVIQVVNLPITTGLIMGVWPFCATQLIQVSPMDYVSPGQGPCTTSTTTTTTIAPVGDCQRVDGLTQFTYVTSAQTSTANYPFANLQDVCAVYNLAVSSPTSLVTVSFAGGYTNWPVSVGSTAWAYDIAQGVPAVCDVIADGFYLLTDPGNSTIEFAIINSVIHVIDGIIVSVDTCGPCNGPFPTEKECYYQLILDGVPQADFSSSLTAACDAADVVLHWPEFNDPLALQPVGEIGKTISWEVGRLVYKTTSTTPPCPDRWTRNGYFVTNWATGEVTEIRGGIIQSITNCAGFTTTTTTTCAALPTNEIILMNTISYDGGVTFQSFTDSEAHACSSRVNYLNAFAAQNILVNLASTNFLGDSITVGTQLYLPNAVNCTQVSNATGYFLTTDTLTNNVIVYVLNGVITAITVCIPTTTTTTCIPQPELGVEWVDYWVQWVRYDIFNNPSAPYVDTSASFESACASKDDYEINTVGTTGAGMHSFLIEDGETVQVGTQLYETNGATYQCYTPSGFTGYLWDSGNHGYDIVHIENGIITEFLDCVDCTSPSGLNSYELMNSYYIGSDPSVNFTETRATACAAVNDCIANPGNYTMTGSDLYATSIQVGNIAWDNSGTSCTHFDNGFHIYNFNGTTYQMIHVLGGVITQIWTDCTSPLAPGPITETQKIDECDERIYEYSVDPEDVPEDAVGLIWDVKCETCVEKPGLTVFVDDIYRVEVEYPNNEINATVSVVSVDADGKQSIFPTTYGVELNECCISYPSSGLLANNIYYDGDDPENGTIFTQSKFDACDALTVFNEGFSLFSGINTKSLDGIELDSTVLNSTTCDSVPNGWYIYIAPSENQYIVNVVDGVIVELVDNNVNPVPDQPTLSSNIDIIANDECGNKYLSFTMVNLPDGATDVVWQSPYGTLVDSGIDENGYHFAIFNYTDNVTFVPTRVYGVREGSCPGPYLQMTFTFSSCG